MSDRLTILTHRSLPLAKTWKADGSIQGYSLAKYFDAREEIVHNINELSELLSKLENDKNSCILRGALRNGEAGKRRVRRIAEEFADQPLHSAMIEVDKWQTVLAGEGAVREYIEKVLPSEFGTASCHWQLSNSAGRLDKRGVLKAHIWFWLAEPKSSASLRAWAEREKIDCDHAVFNEIQVHYTAAPVMDEGVVDPLAGKRSSFIQGLVDEVHINIDDVEEGDSGRKFRQRGEAAGDSNSTDTVKELLELTWEVRGYDRQGGLYIKCPFEAGHSSKSGATECCYFPAGTGGFERGHFKCMHASCYGRSDDEFLEAVGVREPDFTVIEGSKEIVPKSHAVNKDAVESGKNRPPYMTDSVGRPLPTIDNVCMALRIESECGWRIATDTFKNQIMVANVDCVAWERLRDTHYSKIQCKLERGERLFRPINFEIIRRATALVAEENCFDSAQQWLNGLKWDGIKRVESFMSCYLRTVDTPYSRAMGNYLWTALAGRVLVPGIKVDMVPIWQSDEEGHGKTTTIELLVPMKDLFTKINFEEKDDDLRRRMRGKLIGEIPELSGLSYKKEREWINDFITNTREEWTEKYSNNPTYFDRRIVFIATTNNTELFNTFATERRWLPIAVGHADKEAIKRDCNQLWAEGKELFDLCGIMYQEPEKLAVEEREGYRHQDIWQSVINEWLYTKPQYADCRPIDANYITNREIIMNALNMPNPLGVKMHELKRISEIMRSLGFKKSPAWINNRTERVWKKK